MAHTQDIVEYFLLELLCPDTTSLPLYLIDLVSLLSTFSDVFTKPLGLPPTHPNDHAIHLLPNMGTIQVRPYWYPHFQKREMEKLVQKKLCDSAIKPSTSPFSFSILLVHKDRTWFRVDYRTLNAITIKYRFSILSIDEIFDELHVPDFSPN